MPTNTPDHEELIRRAHDGDADALGRILEAQRAQLRRLAEHQLARRLTTRVDGSDVVQQTFLEAQRNFPEFQGQDETALLAWLQRILSYKVAGAVRDHTRLQKRDVRRERSLNAPAPGRSTPPSEPDAQHSTPSQRVIRREETERLGQALATLPNDQREAVRLRHLEGWSLAAIAQHLGRTPAATAGLIKRGVQALRKHLHDGDQSST